MVNKLEYNKLNKVRGLKRLDSYSNDELILNYAKSISGRNPVAPDIFRKLLNKRGLDIDIEYLANTIPEELI